jgi:adenylate kinase family enzyme
MKKVLVVGCSGSGKSVFARKLRDLTNLPLIHLDNIWWNEDKTHITHEEFDSQLNEILSADEWIIDGDFSRTYEMRMRAADTIFVLDYPLEVCLGGAEARIGKKREDLPWVEQEFDKDFERWIGNWRRDKLPVLKNLIEKYSAEKNIIVFKSREEADLFLKTYSNNE